MRLIDIQEIKKLVSFQNPVSISIFIPTHKKGAEVTSGQDSLALKNKIQEVKKQLTSQGMSENQANHILDPAVKLLDDSEFWRQQDNGLAIFLADGFFKYYRTPLKFENFQLVSDQFHLKPLLPLVNNEKSYFILALSLSKVRLFEANRYLIHEIPLEAKITNGIDEVLKEYDFEDNLQQRSQQGGTSSGDNVQFYGQGGSKKDNTPYIQEYFRIINNELKKVITSTDTKMILAAVDYLQPIYRDLQKDIALIDQGITGNPDDLKADELHRESLPKVKSYLDAQKQSELRKYESLAGTGKTSYNLSEIVKEAANGRIEAIFLNENTHQWGSFKKENGQNVEIHEDYQSNDKDLLGISALETVLNGGDAYILEKEELPEKNVETNIMAVYRY